MSHTPGPWHVKDGTLCASVTNPNGHVKTICIATIESTWDDEWLIAAAPEMLAALSRARAVLVLRNTPLDSEERAVVRELDRLLAATRGA